MKGSHFLASPRLRAQSTLRPAALFCQQKIQIDDRLDQRESYESAEAFRLRIAELLQFVTNEFASTDTVYLCTHHDWIEESLSVIPADTDLLDSKYWSWHPAQYAHFEVSDGLWKLKAFSQVTG